MRGGGVCGKKEGSCAKAQGLYADVTMARVVRGVYRERERPGGGILRGGTRASLGRKTVSDVQ